ncbi:hypothetical protein C2I36_13215 [Rhodobacteraceae bacterium WD3A24]|nr:hypothetical protein C2I36_13215 [Rhodobacteraceae bacterium WD3A24]
MTLRNHRRNGRGALAIGAGLAIAIAAMLAAPAAPRPALAGFVAGIGLILIAGIAADRKWRRQGGQGDRTELQASYSRSSSSSSSAS